MWLVATVLDSAALEGANQEVIRFPSQSTYTYVKAGQRPVSVKTVFVRKASQPFW